MSESLPPYSGDAPCCIKCGNLGALTRWMPAYRVGPMICQSEYLHRKCMRCEYSWNESLLEPAGPFVGTPDEELCPRCAATGELCRVCAADPVVKGTDADGFPCGHCENPDGHECWNCEHTPHTDPCAAWLEQSDTGRCGCRG